MNNSNHLVNSDNVGYASYLFEQEKNKGMLPGEVGVPQGMGETGLGQEGVRWDSRANTETSDSGECYDLFPFSPTEGKLEGVFLTFQSSNQWQFPDLRNNSHLC